MNIIPSLQPEFSTLINILSRTYKNSCGAKPPHNSGLNEAGVGDPWSSNNAVCGLRTASISVRGVGLDQRKAQSDSEEANEHA